MEHGDEAEVDRNYKSQNPNNKQITMTEIQNPKPSHHLKKENFKYVLVIEYWNLRFICNLVLGIWDLGMRIEECEMTIAFLSTTDS
jgi:hypothetical protein